MGENTKTLQKLIKMPQPLSTVKLRPHVTAHTQIAVIPADLDSQETAWNQAYCSNANPGRKIAPNTGTNATKFFTLASKSWKLVVKLATRISNHTLPRDLEICKDKSAAKFLVKPFSKMQHMQ